MHTLILIKELYLLFAFQLQIRQADSRHPALLQGKHIWISSLQCYYSVGFTVKGSLEYVRVLLISRINEKKK